MNTIEKDARTEEIYWQQKEIIKRLKALQKDFKASYVVENYELQNKLMNGEITEEYYSAYLDGYEASCTSMAQGLEERFNEITKHLR